MRRVNSTGEAPPQRLGIESQFDAMSPRKRRWSAGQPGRKRITGYHDQMRWLAVVVCGCGRIGFDPGGTTDAPTDLRACAARIPNLIGRWGFEGTIDNLAGASPAVALGNPTFGPGHSGQAIVLDGVDDVVQLPPDLAIESYSFSFWVRTSAVGTGNSTDLWYEGKSLIDAELCGSPVTGDFGTALVDGGHITASGTSEHSAAIINDDIWHHLVYMRDRAITRTFLYLDGSLANDGGDPAPLPHAEIPWIGIGNNPCRFDLGTNFLAGQFDEVAFYDRAITPAEVTSLFECVEP